MQPGSQLRPAASTCNALTAPTTSYPASMAAAASVNTAIVPSPRCLTILPLWSRITFSVAELTSASRVRPGRRRHVTPTSRNRRGL